MAIEIGNIVRVADRAPTPADTKAGLFYNHFRGLEGVVDRIYDDGTLCVVVDHSTLTRDMLARLKRAERVIKPRWKSLSGQPEAENPSEALAEGDEDITGDADESDLRVNPGLRYSIVVKADDVSPLAPGQRRPRAETPRETTLPLRVSEEQLKEAERRHMEELLNRARPE